MCWAAGRRRRVPDDRSASGRARPGDPRRIARGGCHPTKPGDAAGRADPRRDPLRAAPQARGRSIDGSAVASPRPSLRRTNHRRDRSHPDRLVGNGSLAHQGHLPKAQRPVARGSRRGRLPASRTCHVTAAPAGNVASQAARRRHEQRPQSPARPYAPAPSNWRSMFANSRRNEAYWASKSSSGIPGDWNIVKL